MKPIATHNETTLYLENFSGDEIRFFSKPGLPYWDTISPSQLLLTENSKLEHGANVLILGCGHGAHILILALRHPKTQFTVSDNNGISLNLLPNSIKQNNILNVSISFELSLFPQMQGIYDYVMIDLPKGRKLCRRWLMEAYLTIKQNGILLLAGANDQGIQSVAKDGNDLFGHRSVIALKKGNRLIQFSGKKPQEELPAWSEAPGIFPGKWIEMQTTIKGLSYQIKTLPGVFASDGLDPGTAFLLEHLDFNKNGTVLEFGCGCGVIGTVLARNSRAWIDMTDIDRYALAAANENIKAYGLSNCEAFFSDGLEAVSDKKYDLILTNPPFHSGKVVDYSMTHNFIAQSSNLLSKGGELILVANQFIRYDRIINKYSYEVQPPITNKQYTIWTARKA